MSDHLNSLYPFLSGEKKDAASENSALLESVRQKSQHSLDTKQKFFAENAQALVDAANAVAEVYRRGNKLFSMGNGGSSCDASHFAVEFQHPVTAGRPSLSAYNLTIDTAFFSAVSNDVGVKHVFARQIEAHGRAGDGLVGFSTSGNSENLMAGFRKAKDLGLTTIGFAGGTSGDMKSSGLVDYLLIVDTDSIHRVQEVHVACYHILWDLTHTLLADNRGKLGKQVAKSEAPEQPSDESTAPTPTPEKKPKKAAPLRPQEIRHDLSSSADRLWEQLKDSKLAGAEFKRGHTIGDIKANFACENPALVILLGRNQQQTAPEQAKTHWLETQGFKVLHFWNNEVLNNTDRVLKTILEELENPR